MNHDVCLDTVHFFASSAGNRPFKQRIRKSSAMFSQFHRIAFACLCMGMAREGVCLRRPVVRLFGSALHAAPPSHRRRLSSFPIEFILGSIQKAKASELKRTASGRKRHRSISCACELGQQCAMLQEEHVLLAQTRNNGRVCEGNQLGSRKDERVPVEISVA